ncbi:CHAT domain-containing protein [Halorussus ruber]|uniref:hypothetical protein n=1 Tax=Halorussus ruber TaxID=1126238 RepID=UPI001091B623|nr:hypothetical protein [Halorussus ruber]
MSTHPKFRPLSEEAGLDIVDPIETRHFSLLTDSPVEPTEVDPERFAFPVATACRIRTGEVTLPHMIPMDVRSPEGDHRTSIDPPTSREFPEGEYLLELHSPIKVYLQVSGALSIDATEETVRIEFGGETAVEVGARSYHSSPAATITVPDDPAALMKAVSAFSSALKTTSPERSWPTLRGHPPRIERGDELDIPDGLDAPETGIRIAVPPEYGYVYAVAPLAYYLGAEIVPSGTANLTAESGVSEYLGSDVGEVGESVEDILKRVFLLDCVTRTEGLYPDELHERDVLEARTDLDFEDLYESSIADRLADYLAVDDEAVAAIESPWHRVTHVEAEPGPDAAELMPYVVNDLSLVKVKTASDEAWSPTEAQRQTSEALAEFVRSPTSTARAGGGGRNEYGGERGSKSGGERGSEYGGDDDFLRSARTTRSIRRSDGIERPDDQRDEADADWEDDGDPAESADREEAESARGVPGEGGYMPLPESDALERAWIGDRTPIEGTKLLKEAFEHDVTASENGAVEITVVCNDEEMREEWDAAAEIYADREDLRANVTCEFDVSTDELRDLLAADSDMFHFIGHIDGHGFQCADGIVDAEEIEKTGAETVLLNGCRSHDQGIELVKSGARAAVVSLADLWNAGAVEVGETLARLFFHGFTIGHAMTIVREYTSLGREYVVVGDPGVTLAQCENGLPSMYHIQRNSGDEDLDTEELLVEAHSYPIRGYNIGSSLRMHLDKIDTRHIAGGGGIKCRTKTYEFREAFNSNSEPLVVDGKLLWTDEFFTV